MPTVQPPSTLEFKSEYEIVNWLADHPNFEAAVAQLRAALANGTIANGRGLVERWLSVYDDVTAGRVIGSKTPIAQDRPPEPAKTGAPKPIAPAERRTGLRRSGDGGPSEDVVNSGFMLDEAQQLAEAAREAARHANQRVDVLEDQLRRATRTGRLAFLLALLALAAIVAVGFAQWPLLEPRWQDLLRFLSS